MQSLIRYLRACYREDNARIGIWDIFGNAVEFPTFVDGDEQLAQGFVDTVHLPPKRAGTLAENADRYQREKRLVYAGLFLVGQAAPPWSDSTQTVCAPVVTFPASIDKAGSQLGIEITGRRFNGPALDHLGECDPDTDLSDALEDAAGTGSLGPPEVTLIAGVLERAISGMALDPTAGYPQLQGKKALQEAVAHSKKNPGEFTIVPAFCAALVKNPTGSRGVLTELQQLADTGAYSLPVRTLLDGADAAHHIPLHSKTPTFDRVPAILSEPQQKILHSARSRPLTLAVGPPGTGKSFTIAAIALDHLARGQSVLIASKMDHAVDVVAEKIAGALGSGGAVVRSGKSQYLKDLKTYIDDLLSGMHTGDDIADIKTLRRQIALGRKSIAKNERAIAKANARHARWGRFLSAGKRGWFARLRTRWILRRVARTPPLAELLSHHESALDQHVTLAKTNLRTSRAIRLRHLLDHARHDLLLFRKAVRSRTSSKQADYFEKLSLKNILTAFPIWLVNLSDAHRALPFAREMFDVAIIDESSQCDIASALPVLQRAKRAVIAGDPKQLRHLSFLSTRRLENIAAQNGIDPDTATKFHYRKCSLLDLFATQIDDQSQVGFLNEHYRSQPPIIDFSNRRFYSDRLHIMTHRKVTRPGPALSLIYCQNGRRRPGGHNPEEAEAVVSAVTDLIRAEIDLPRDSAHTIGVLSPFRAQVDHLQKTLASALGELSARAHEIHELVVGTAHSFQGEERDILFLSLAIDADSPSAARRFLEQPDVFNVAITRARQNQHIFISIPPEKRPATGILAEYFNHIAAVGSGLANKKPVGNSAADRFATEVTAELERAGCACVAGYPMGHLDLDLLVTRGEHRLGVDLIGFSGPTAPAFPLERYLMFHRAGLRLFPLTYARWLVDRENCLNEILATLSPNNPIQISVDQRPSAV